jgi:hypothetical protein
MTLEHMDLVYRILEIVEEMDDVDSEIYAWMKEF